MRRKDRQITEPAKIEKIIAQGRVCHLTLHDLPAPYVVPLSFGYKENTLYFHAARDGHKVDLMQQNPQAGFAISIDLGDVDGGDEGCEWSVGFRSVLGHGNLSIVEATDEKREAFDCIMAQYSDRDFTYPAAMVERTLVFKLAIETMTGKAGND